tara:strand:- start:423 stop:788 length:366 start_codon:yes stop_codon:yes gene_type:complete
MDIYGIRDIDDLIYYELHKMNLKVVCENIRNMKKTKLWENPSTRLRSIVRDKGCFEHNYNDIVYEMKKEEKEEYDIYLKEHCANCEYYGFPCRNCCCIFPQPEGSSSTEPPTFEIFNSNWE